MANLGTTINSCNLQMLQKFESLEFDEQIYALSDTLEANGCTLVDKTRKTGKKNICNFVLESETSDYVFAVIFKVKEREMYYSFLDKAVYKSCMDTKEGVVLNYSQRQMNDKKIILSGGQAFYNQPLHREAVICDNLSVDHVTHNAAINIREYLRVCTTKENNFNKPKLCKIDEHNFSFYASIRIVKDEDRQFFSDKNFRFTKSRVYSPKYSSMDELYSAIKEFEEKCVGEFRYNPLKDFSETWYALVLCKMLGVLTEEELLEYNREYMCENHEDVARYYQL